MPDQEISKCSMCGKTTNVLRRYCHYNIKCDCCYGDKHFIVVSTCSECKPKPPSKIWVLIEMEADEFKEKAEKYICYDTPEKIEELRDGDKDPG